jgi:hypothetical protein
MLLAFAIARPFILRQSAGARYRPATRTFITLIYTRSSYEIQWLSLGPCVRSVEFVLNDAVVDVA